MLISKLQTAFGIMGGEGYMGGGAEGSLGPTTEKNMLKKNLRVHGQL